MDVKKRAAMFEGHRSVGVPQAITIIFNLQSERVRNTLIIPYCCTILTFHFAVFITAMENSLSRDDLLILITVALVSGVLFYVSRIWTYYDNNSSIMLNISGEECNGPMVSETINEHLYQFQIKYAAQILMLSIPY